MNLRIMCSASHCNDNELVVWARGDAQFPILNQDFEVASAELEIHDNLVIAQEWSLTPDYSCIDYGFGSPFPRKAESPLASQPFLFPNPTHGQRQLAFESFSAEVKTVQISDLKGRTLHQFHIAAEVSQLKLPLLASGLYIVRVQAANSSWQEKLVVQ